MCKCYARICFSVLFICRPACVLWLPDLSVLFRLYIHTELEKGDNPYFSIDTGIVFNIPSFPLFEIMIIIVQFTEFLVPVRFC